jgi:predicted choloylglycine hydrolase
LTPDYPIEKIEVAGTHRQIGFAYGQWYQERDFLPRPLTADEQLVANKLLALYEDVHPSIIEQIRGMYAAFGLNLDDMSKGIPVYDAEGIRILLPGVVEREACSVVFTRPEVTVDGHARLGRNFDWPEVMPDTTLIFTYPEGGYPTVIMTARAPGFSAFEGLNSQGLALGSASVGTAGYKLPEGPALVAQLAYRLILEHSANVEQAIAMLRSIPITFVTGAPDNIIGHILLADRSGASAVVEFLPAGITVSRTDTPYQVMTNSHWAGPADQPNCKRYQNAIEGLEKARGEIDTEGLIAVMSSIRASTQWTSVYDLENLSLDLTLPSDDFTTHYEFSLADFIARMNAR